ncbi:hypothetical protein GQ53DRAFT_804273 [Thozetella sp. PMI_491]|nr:hypothetical protein GQ53DRAFT_804273 [Thozetella sp. PMI_491]
MSPTLETTLDWTISPSLAERAVQLNTTTSTAVLTQTIHTPWPIVLLLWIISLVFVWISSKRNKAERARWQELKGHNLEPDLYVAPIASDKEDTKFRIGWLTVAVWIFNLLRSMASMGFIVYDIVMGKFPVPGEGMAVALASLMANALHVYDGIFLMLAGYASFVIAVLGMVVYVVSGGYSMMMGPDSVKSLRIQLDRGCSGNLYNRTVSGPLLCDKPMNNQTLYVQTDVDTGLFVCWIFGLTLLVGIIALYAAIKGSKSFTTTFSDCTNAIPYNSSWRWVGFHGAVGLGLDHGT